MEGLSRRVAVVIALGAVIAAVVLSVVISRLGGDRSAVSYPTYPTTDDPVVWVTGDSCEPFADPEGCDDVNALIRADDQADAVLLVGDAQYDDGSLDEYRQYYDKEMAPEIRDITWPVIGNHDYNTPDAAGYWNYWGARAGTRGEGWYTFDLDAWRIIAANSNCRAAGGCYDSTDQSTFIDSALAGPEKCELLFTHFPPFSDAQHGDTAYGAALFERTYRGGGDLYVAGHDHTYQRFAPKRPDGSDDPASGVRSLVVGTGGAGLYEWAHEDRTEFRQNTQLGAVRLVLGSDGYTGRFLNTEGRTLDTFSGSCH